MGAKKENELSPNVFFRSMGIHRVPLLEEDRIFFGV